MGGAWEDLNPVSPNKGEQAMSTEQQGSCVTIELLNQTSKMYQDISKERREGEDGECLFFPKYIQHWPKS